MNGDKFIAWVRNRLLPTFKKVYPGKKMYLVIDNAPYHKPRDESWVTASAKSKLELAHTLLDLGVESLTTNAGQIIPSNNFFTSASIGGPKHEDLVTAVKSWIDGHPDHNMNVVQQLLNDAGHSVIYTPPFCPEPQPIELLWGKVKCDVASRSLLNRSITEARQHTEEAFEALNKPFFWSIIKHCQDWIDSFIQSEEGGDLRQCRTLAGVMRSLTLLKIANQRPKKQQPSSDNQPMVLEHPPATSSSSSSYSLRKRH